MRGEHMATRLLQLKTTSRQIHFYSNRDCLEPINATYAQGGRRAFDWGELYSELFKPGPVLSERIRAIQEKIGCNYYGAVFRFQNLLGDFQEYRYKSLNSKDDAEQLIGKCLDAVEQVKAVHGNLPLLVTSDSVTFLQRVVQIEGVHIIPGTLVHMDEHKNSVPQDSYATYLKSFLDFYMLSEAQKIYRILRTCIRASSRNMLQKCTIFRSRALP